MIFSNRTLLAIFPQCLITLVFVSAPKAQAQSVRQISGTVIDAAGVPLEGVRVHMSVPVVDSPRGHYELSYDIRTDASGQFTFDGGRIPTKPIIEFEKVGYASRGLAWDVQRDSEVQLVKPFDLAGRVTGYNGKPIAGASVAIVPMSNQWFPILHCKTDDQGGFRIEKLSTLPVRVVASAENLSPQMLTIETIESSDEQASCDLLLVPGRRIRFSVNDNDGKPIENVSIESMKWRGHGGLRLRCTTDEQGRSSLRSAPGDSVEYRFRHPDFTTKIASFAAGTKACEVVLDAREGTSESFDNGNGKSRWQTLHLCEMDGSVVRRLITNKEINDKYFRQGSPNISADGSTIAFDAREPIEGKGWQDARVIVANVDGSEARVLSDGVLPSLSPDGSHIAFTRTQKSTAKIGIDGNSIWTMKTDGTGLKMVADKGAWGVHWTSDGRSLVYIGGRDQNGSYNSWNHLQIHDISTGIARPAWSKAESPFSSIEYNFNTSHRGRMVVVYGKLRDGTDTLATIDLERGIESIRHVRLPDGRTPANTGRVMDFDVSNRFLLITSSEGGRKHPQLLTIDGHYPPQDFPGLPSDRTITDAITTLEGNHVIAVIESN